MIPAFNAWSYTTVCGEHDIYCMIYVMGCDGNVKKQRRGLRDFLKLVRKTLPHINDIEENYAPKWIQFGYIDVVENKLLKPLCHGSNDTELILVSEAQTMMKIVSKSVKDFDDQLLFEYIESIFNHESDDVTIDAPRIIPPPPPKKTMIDDMIEYIEDLDWRDKDLQLNIIIIACLIGFVFVCKNCGLKGAVMTLFAMSIFGGMLPIMLQLMGGGGTGPKL